MVVSVINTGSSVEGLAKWQIDHKNK